MKQWYTITNRASGPAEISIIGPIGATWDGEGMTAAQFIADFKAISAPEVTVTVSSPGGSLIDGLAIYSAMAASGKKITAKVLSVAASAASVLLMAASRIEMPKNTHMMAHKASGGMFGTADELRGMAEVVDSLNESIIKTYAARTGKTEDEIRALLDNGDLWLTAEKAVELGFADVATDLVKVTASFDIDKLPEHVRAVFEAAAKPPAPAIQPPAQPLTPQIVAAAKAAGLESVALAIAAHPKATDLAGAQSVIAEALEIKALADLAHRPEDADAFIRAAKPLAEVRAELHERDAAAAREQIINTTPTAQSLNQPAGQPQALDIGGLWAKINATHAGNKQ